MTKASSATENTKQDGKTVFCFLKGNFLILVGICESGWVTFKANIEVKCLKLYYGQFNQQEAKNKCKELQMVTRSYLNAIFMSLMNNHGILNKQENKKSILAQPSFQGSETSFLLDTFLPGRQDDNFKYFKHFWATTSLEQSILWSMYSSFSNHRIWLGAERPDANATLWRFLETPNPGDFPDSHVRPWGAGEPRRRLRAGLMMARLRRWEVNGFLAVDPEGQGHTLCEVRLQDDGQM